MVAHYHVDIYHEKPHPTGDEEDESYYHRQEKHGISPYILLSVAAKLYKVSGYLSMVFSFHCLLIAFEKWLLWFDLHLIDG